MFSKLIHKLLLLFAVFVFAYCAGSGSKTESKDTGKKAENKTEELCAVATEICELTEKEKAELKEEAKKEDAGNRFVGEENEGFYEGDIKLTEEQQDVIDKKKKDQKENTAETRMVGMPPVIKRWGIDTKVPYKLDDLLNREARQAIQEAHRYIERHACVEFKERQAENDYIRYFPGHGCWSHLGRIGGEQDLSIGHGCETKGVVLHETLHALGFLHEHNRLDRDAFINIHWENIQQGKERYFDKYVIATETFGYDYDYNSVMHYPARAFSDNDRKTITVKGSRCTKLRYYFGSLGQRNAMSARDIYQLNLLFQCLGIARLRQGAKREIRWKRFDGETKRISDKNSTRPEYTCKLYKDLKKS